MALRNGRSNVAKDESLTRTTAVDEIFENAQDLNPHFAEVNVDLHQLGMMGVQSLETHIYVCMCA